MVQWRKPQWAKLKSPISLVGWGILFIKPAWRLVEVLGDLDFLLRNAKPALDFLNTGLGTVILMMVGFGLVIFAVMREAVSSAPEEPVDPTFATEELEQARPEGEHLREQLGILYRSVADSAYNRAHELLGQIAQRLKEFEGDIDKHTVGVLLNRYVMEADRAARTKLAPALDSDAAPIDDSDHLQNLFGDYFDKYQQLAEWIHRAGELIGFPEFMGDTDYLRWRDEDREFLQRLRDLIALSEFSRLRQHVQRVGWGEKFRPTL